MSCLREGTVAMLDRRRVGFAEFGVRGSRPVLHFHGMPGGRCYDLDAAALHETGTWLLTVERPGIGLSDPQPGRRVLDWPADVEQVANAFGITDFAVLGTSGGAP